MKASWKETLLKNPDAKKLLASLPVNPVFQAAYKPEDNKDGNPQGQALLASYDAIKDPAARTAFSRSTGKNCFLRSTNSPENSLTHYI